MKRRCEHRRTRGESACNSAATFRVSRGRQHDAQNSCRRHLAATVRALIGAEYGKPVTVQLIRPGESANANTNGVAAVTRPGNGD